MVYFLTDGEYIKIGIATNLKNRVAKLQTGNARKIKILKIIDGYRCLEKKLHNIFISYRLEGEWFNITEQQIDNVLQELYLTKSIDSFEIKNEKSRGVWSNDGVSKQLYSSLTDASKSTGVCHTAISRCCQGKRKSAGGYNWFYDTAK